MHFDLLVVCDHFRPGFKAGGPIVSVDNLTQLLRDKLDILVVTRGRDIGDQAYYPEIELDSILKRDGVSVYYVKSFGGYLKAMFRLKYGVLYLNSFFSPFCFVFFLSSLFSPSRKRVIAPRGELGAGAMNIKSFKKTVFSTLFRSLGLARKATFHTTSIDESESVMKVLKKTSVVIPNIGQLGNGAPTRLEKRIGQARFIYLSRIARKKNLLAALASLTELKWPCHVEFDIYGPIEDEKYWEECSQIIRNLPKHIVANYKGAVPPSRVSLVLRDYHALLLPTFNENYGHVIVEAMDNGLLPIISDQTPWRNLTTMGVGWDVSLSQTQALTSAIEAVLGLDDSNFRKMSRNAQSFIRNCSDQAELRERYLNIFLNA